MGQLTLSLLVGKIFTMVSTKFRGIRLCEPYAYLSGKLSPEILKNMAHRAGLRAQILESCIIKVSEEVSDKQPDQVLNRIPLRDASC